MTDAYRILSGDCLDLLKEIPDCSVDAVIADPPYGLSDHGDITPVLEAWLKGEAADVKKKGFMGKAWDGFVPGPEYWRLAFKLLKPGGHLLAFAGSRTSDLMGVALRLAGFEIRDTLQWVYGSGFPKSLDVSKAIDKCNAEGDRALRFTRWFRDCGVTRKQATDAMIEAGHISPRGTMAAHYFAADRAGQPAIPTRSIWATLRPLCADVPAWVDELVERVEAEREVVGTAKSSLGGTVAAGERNQGFIEQHKSLVYTVTAPATDAAKRWAGWGTALKPAFEPIILARKPLIGTVAANVLAHGTGGLNIDGCRVPLGREQPKGSGGRLVAVSGDGRTGAALGMYGPGGNGGNLTPDAGRWPANVVHDGSDEVIEAFDSYSTGSHRFFYAGKATKRDREEGLEDLVSENGSRKNVHPTVKPTALMRWLCRLITPPGGLVLDPFCGSGSTGKAALLEGFRFIGIEREAEYAAVAERRIAWAAERAG